MKFRNLLFKSSALVHFQLLHFGSYPYVTKVFAHTSNFFTLRGFIEIRIRYCLAGAQKLIVKKTGRNIIVMLIHLFVFGACGVGAGAGRNVWTTGASFDLK